MKKKIMSWLLVFAMVIGFAPVNLHANESTQAKALTSESDFTFDASTGTIKKYNGTDSVVEVPSTINGVEVKHIGKGAIGGKKNLTKIVLPEGIETIGDQAFFANINLKKVNFPDSLKSIGHSIFMGDKALEGELTLGSNLELLDRFTFGDGAGTRLGSQNVKLNIAPGKTKLTILRGTFGSEQTNVDIPQERPLLIKVNAFRTEEPVTLDFGTIDVKKGISKEDLLKTLQEKVLLNLFVSENDYKSMNEVGKGYELPIDWKLDAIDTNSESEVSIENYFTYNDEELREALSIDPETKFSSGDLDEILQNIKVVGKLNFKEETEEPVEPSEPEEPIVTEWTQEDFTYGEFQYKNRMEEETFKFGITGFSEKGKSKIAKNPDLVIPKEVTIDGEVKQIEGIAAHAFKGIKMNSVTFSEVDKGIGYVIKDSAFENTGLTKVTLQEGLISIETRVFMNNNLTEISIPSTVWKIGSESFRGNKISTLDISDDVNMIQIDNYSFEGNELSVVKLPYSIFKFRDFVFRDNPGYENSGVVRLETRNPDHLSSTTYIVPENEFHKVVLITDVNRSELFKELQKVKDIDRADYKEEDLAEFDKVLNDAKEVFKDQKSTQEQIDKALNDLIAAEAKLRSSSPDRSKLRDSIKRAEELNEAMFTPESYGPMKKALDEAKSVLKDLDKTSEEITEAQSKLDKAIEDLVINESALYTSEDFTYEGKTITGFSESGWKKFEINKDLVLPDTNPEGEDIEVIGKGAFSLEKDPGVKFGTDTVSSANGMVSVKLPKNLKRIEDSALRLNNFKNIDFPETLEFIGISALNGNRLEKVYLPDSVTEVEGGAFSLNQIIELRLSPNMKKVADGTFSRNILLKELVIPEGIEVIEGSAFQGCPLTSLSISSTVKEIKQRAFTGQQLEELTIPGNVKKIGRQAFAHNIKWKRLKKLTLEEGIEEIGDSAFRFSLLQETKLPKSLLKLADTAFKNAETTDKKPVVVKLYTENKDHLKFNNENSLKNQEVIYVESTDPTEPTEPSTPGVPTDPTEPSKPTEPEKIETDRTKGKDRVETAIEISKKYFGKADTVIVVDKKDFPDAMTSSVLSKLLKAPILLTDTNKLDPRVAAEIERLGARDVIIVGGDSSVSEAVKRELAKFDKNEVERIYGKDRYETSAQVARRVVEITGKLGHAVVASGEVFADALAVAPYASREGYPILLVKANNLPKSVKDAITELAINKVTIAGGYSTVERSLEASLPTVVERLRGDTRYETAIAIADKHFSGSKETFLANGEEWMDALVIGPVGGLLNMPILLTGANSAPQSLKDYIAKSNIEKIIAIGGRSMVSDRVLSELSK